MTTKHAESKAAVSFKFKSTFAPFTTMEQISSIQNYNYIISYMENITKKRPESLHPMDMTRLCSKAVSINNEELFWRAWATLAQIISKQTDTCNVTIAEKTKLLTELGQIGGQTWGHEGILTPHFQ